MNSKPQCQSCQVAFDTLHHTPLKLPCQHTLCQNCIYNQFEQLKKNICFFSNCKKVSQVQPRTLKEDQEILDLLVKEQDLIDNLSTTIQKLQGQQKYNKETLKGISMLKTRIIQLFFNQIQRILFASCNSMTQELLEQQKQIQQKLNQIEMLQNMLEKPNFQISTSEMSCLKYEESVYQELTVKCQQQKENLMKFTNLLDQHLEHFLKAIILQKPFIIQSQEQNNSESNANQIQEEIKSSKFLNNQYSVNNILTILASSNLKKIYKIDQKIFQTQQIKIDKTSDDYTQVEQIEDQKLVISGGFYQNKMKFTFIENESIQNFNMITGRRSHRTVFDLNNKIYIILGCDDNIEIKQNEVFCFQKKKFTQLSDSVKQAYRFGAFLEDSKNIYAIGGNINQIQVYNCEKNE